MSERGSLVNAPWLDKQQRYALSSLLCNSRFCLWWDPGTGKTRPLITALNFKFATSRELKALIVAPKIVLEDMWLPICRTCVPKERIHYTNKSSKAVLDLISQWSTSPGNRVLLVPWSKLMATFGQLPVIPNAIGLTIMDESHLCKNVKPPHKGNNVRPWTKVKTSSAQGHAAAMVSASSSICWHSTGSAVDENPLDAWGQFFVLDQGRTLGPCRDTFYATYGYAITHRGRVSWKPKPSSLALITSRIKHKVHFRKSTRTNSEGYTVINYPVNKGLYNLLKKEMSVFLKGSSDETFLATAKEVNAKLSQWMSGFVYYNGKRAMKVEGSDKTKHLSSLINNIKTPVLVFYWYAFELDEIKRTLNGRGGWLKGMSAQSKLKSLSDFRDGKLKWLALQPMEAGTGIELQAKNNKTIVWWSLPANRSSTTFKQANRRVSRRGGAEKVTIYIPRGFPVGFDYVQYVGLLQKKNITEMLTDYLS